MFSKSKAQFKKQIKQKCPYLPYPISKNLILLSNQGYVNWLEEYIFQKNKKTTQYLKNKNCLFIHIPKCGGNSVYKGLFHTPRMGHLNAFDYLIALGKHEYENRFKFTFVRNPWSRLVSAYYFLKQRKYFDWFYYNIGDFENFDSFVKNWVTKSNIYREQTFIPQSDFITIGNQIKVDFIGRCENMKTDMEYIATQIGVDFDYKVENRSQHPDYRELYTAKSKDIVFKVYKKDIENFGYEF